MKKIAFIDLDGVLVNQGTQNFISDAKEKLQELAKEYEIWFFSCWDFNESDVKFLSSIGVSFGMIRKPLADQYIYIDDKLDVKNCATSLLISVEKKLWE